MTMMSTTAYLVSAMFDLSSLLAMGEGVVIHWISELHFVYSKFTNTLVTYGEPSCLHTIIRT
jgi:hypothetical protein